MSSSNYPTVNYDVFIPSDWTSTAKGGGFTEAELNTKYLRFPNAQTNQAEVLNNVTLNGVIFSTQPNPFVIQNPLSNFFISSNKNITSTGQYNTCLGNSTFNSLTTGNNNTAVGNNSLNLCSKQSDNTAIGYNALYQLSNIAGLGFSNNGNTAIGSQAGSGFFGGVTINSTYNTFIGYNSGVNSYLGANNTFLGSNSGIDTLYNIYNKSTAIGYGSTITASNQIVLGTSSETVNIVGLLGKTSSSVNNPIVSTNANYNVLFGSKLTADTVVTGSYNSSIGHTSFSALTAGSYNTAVGAGALTLMSGSNYNSGIGYGAGQLLGFSSLGGDYNVYIGYNSGSNHARGNNNTFLGSTTSVTSGGTTYNNSTAIGYGANISKSNQIVMGTTAESISIPSGIIYTNSSLYNVIFNSSVNALSNITGNYNAVFGNNAISNLTSGSRNMALGYGSLASCGVDNDNVGIGYNSLTSLNGGNFNTSIGSTCGSSLSSGAYNTFIGGNSGLNLSSGNNNTFIGYNSSVNNAGVGSIPFTQSTAIGYNSVINGNNQIVMGTSTESVVIPSREIIGLASPIAPSIGTTFSISGITGYNLSTSGNPPLVAGMNIYSPSTAVGTQILSGSGNNWVVNISQSVGPQTGVFQSIASFTITSVSGTSITTSGSPPLAIGMVVYWSVNPLASLTGLPVIVSGSGNSWTISVSQTTVSNAFTAYYIPTTSFAIQTISTTNMTTTGNPPLTPNMVIYGPNIANGTAIVSGSGNSWTISISNTVTVGQSGYYPTSNFGITSISASGNTSLAGTTMVTTNNPPLGIGMYILAPTGTGISSFTRINSGSGNTWTLSSSQLVLNTTGNPILPFNLNFPLSEVYYITPSMVTNYPIYISLPSTFSTTNIGAKTSFRVVASAYNNNVSPPTGNTVSLISINFANIFDSITTGAGNIIHNIYISGSQALLSHTYYVLPSAFSTNGYGWFQQGSV